MVEFLVNKARLPWAKVAYIEAITATVRQLLDQTAKLAIGLTSADLPMCIVLKDKRVVFADTAEPLCEGRIQADFLNWLQQERHLTVAG